MYCRLRYVLSFFRLFFRDMSKGALFENTESFNLLQDGDSVECVPYKNYQGRAPASPTPAQIKQMVEPRDEIAMLHTKEEGEIVMGTHMFSNGIMERANDNTLALLGDRTSTCVYDGHGTWFNDDSQADGSAKMIEGQLKIH